MGVWRATYRWFLVALVVATPILLAALSHAASEPKFPALTGRVVDQAGALSEGTRARLTRALEDFERDTKRQVVVHIVDLSLRSTRLSKGNLAKTSMGFSFSSKQTIR